MKQYTDLEIKDSVRIDRDPQAVFAFLTDAGKLKTWWPVSAESDPREGGELVFGWQTDSTTGTRFSTFIPDRRVAFEFGKEFVELTIAGIREGCILAVRHSRITIPEDSFDLLVHIAQSWTFLLLNLKSVMEHGIDLRESWM